MVLFVYVGDTNNTRNVKANLYHGEAHAEPEDTARICYKPDYRDLLVSADLRHHRVLDIDIDQGKVVLRVPIDLVHQIRVCKSNFILNRM
jgi:hypothetical protein